MPRVVHFEIAAKNPEKAAKFYKSVFGWKFEKWKGPIDYWLIMTGPKKQPGIDGGLTRREGLAPKSKAPLNAFVCTVDISNVDNYLKKVTKAGGTIVIPKTAVPSVGWMAYCNDIEGNLFGLMQEDRNAK